MMRLFIGLMMIAMLVAGCEGDAPPSSDTDAPQPSGAVRVVEQYLTLLVNKDETGFAQTLCPAYERDGMREFRSFGAVDASLNEVSCAEDGTEDAVVFVVCTGTIELVYQGEDTRGLDLSRETYRATQDDGEWKVCGKGRDS